MIPPSAKRAMQDRSERTDLRADLDRLEQSMNELKVQYEQYFTGLLPLPPDKLHGDVKRSIRTLRKAPFKSSALQYRLRGLETRYSTWNTYWQRVLREREEGVYFKDVFKADLRAKIAEEEAHQQTAQGVVERGMRNLFDAYQSALERHQGTKPNIDFNAFCHSLSKRAHDFRSKHADKKLSFKVVVKDGKVTVQARVKE